MIELYKLYKLDKLYELFIGNPINFNKALASSLVLALVTTETSRPKMSFKDSKLISGKILCSGIPTLKTPFSNDFGSRPRKSLVRGKPIETNLSIKSYILLLRKVTLYPIFIPCLILKLAIDFLATVGIGFCPVKIARSFSIFSNIFPSLTYLPVPTFKTTFFYILYLNYKL